MYSQSRAFASLAFRGGATVWCKFWMWPRVCHTIGVETRAPAQTTLRVVASALSISSMLG